MKEVKSTAPAESTLSQRILGNAPATGSNNDEQPIGTASAEQIAEWKKKHPVVKWHKADNHICYYTKPSRLVMDLASKADTPMKANDIYIKNMWLGGSEEILNNDSYYLGFCKAVSKEIQIVDGEQGEC